MSHWYGAFNGVHFHSWYSLGWLAIFYDSANGIVHWGVTANGASPLSASALISIAHTANIRTPNLAFFALFVQWSELKLTLWQMFSDGINSAYTADSCAALVPECGIVALTSIDTCRLCMHDWLFINSGRWRNVSYEIFISAQKCTWA